MTQVTFSRAVLVALVLVLTTRAEGAPETPAPDKVAPVLEPKAVELLKAMSARLAAARTMTFTAVATYESPSRLGAPLAYTTISDVALQRPDKLRVLTPGDGPATEFYYDGKTMMAYAPAESLVASTEAPPTIDAALKAAYDAAAIYFPFTDVLVSDPYKDISDGLLRAFVVGQSRVIGGTMTDIVSIATHQVFAQIWIGVDDKLPRMIRAVYPDDAARLRHQVELLKWRIDDPLAADVFDTARVTGAQRIEFARPDPKPPADAPPAGSAKTPSQAKPSKTK